MSPLVENTVPLEALEGRQNSAREINGGPVLSPRWGLWKHPSRFPGADAPGYRLAPLPGLVRSGRRRYGPARGFGIRFESQRVARQAPCLFTLPPWSRSPFSSSRRRTHSRRLECQVNGFEEVVCRPPARDRPAAAAGWVVGAKWKTILCINWKRI